MLNDFFLFKNAKPLYAVYEQLLYKHFAFKTYLIPLLE